MFEIKRKAILICAILFINNSFAQSLFQFGGGKLKHRISLGPVITSYKNNPQHTVNTKAKSGFNAAYKIEVSLDRKTNFLTGLEYLSQGLTFNGYYSAPKHTYLFDKTFSYLHEIRYQELQLPLLVKHYFKLETANSFTPYFFTGIGLRYIYKSTTFIESDSTQNAVYDGKTDVTFENFCFDKHLNAFFQGGLGTQRNFREKGSVLFLEFTYRYNISRLYYTGYQNSNNLNIRDACLAITVGVRF